MAKILEGSIPSLVTPFNDDESLDEESLRNQIDFVLKEGVHGVIVNALLGEGYKLTAEERKRVLEITVEQVNGRVPVVDTIIANSAKIGVEHAVLSKEIGADFIMAPPPSYYPVTQQNIYDYYVRLSNAVDIEMVVFDAPDLIGVPIELDTLEKIVRDCKNAKYLKFEVPKPGPAISHYQARFGDRCSIIWGMAGMYALEAYKRGAVGLIGAAESTKLIYDIHNHLKNNNDARAREIYNRNFQWFTFLMASGNHAHAVSKKVLYWKGVIKTDKIRLPGQPLDDIHVEELKEILKFVGEPVTN